MLQMEHPWRQELYWIMPHRHHLSPNVSFRVLNFLVFTRTSVCLVLLGHHPKVQSSLFPISTSPTVNRNGRKIDLTAVIVPKVTCDLPIYPVPSELSWTHITDVPLADAAFGQPGRINIFTCGSGNRVWLGP